MPRNQFSDITPRKRSIRDIPLPQGKQVVQEEHEQVTIPEGYFADIGERKPRKKKYVFLIVILLVLGFWGASVFLHGATVRITPQKAEFKGTITIEAKADATPADIQYDSLQFTESASKKVATGVEEAVSIKASGRITVYNAYSTTAQELVSNTRFETPDGKIYRIQKTVTVPGYKTVDGAKVPGSIETTVYADVAGEAYNGAKTDFTIPGFKGTAKYQGFYARSTTNITGGFVGKQKKIDPELLAATIEELKTQIENRADQSIASKIPADFVFIKGGRTIEYTVAPVTPDGTDSGTVTVDGMISAFVFKKLDLNNSLLKAVPGSTILSINIRDYGALSIANVLEDATKKTLVAKISGTALGFAEIDRDGLAGELAGIKKSAIGAVMNTHPEIVESQIFIRPPWMRSLPKNPEKIHVTENIDL